MTSPFSLPLFLPNKHEQNVDLIIKVNIVFKINYLFFVTGKQCL